MCTVFWSSSLKSLTPLSAKTLLHGMRLFSEINRAPASSLSTQAYRGKPRSEKDLSALGFSPAIETSTLSCTLFGLASCMNESKSIALSNKWMIEQSDVVVTYVFRGYGGAAKFVELARGKEKIIWNIV